MDIRVHVGEGQDSLQVEEKSPISGYGTAKQKGEGKPSQELPGRQKKEADSRNLA